MSIEVIGTIIIVLLVLLVFLVAQTNTWLQNIISQLKGIHTHRIEDTLYDVSRTIGSIQNLGVDIEYNTSNIPELPEEYPFSDEIKKTLDRE